MAENEQDKPKIFIDDDWKAQAEAEKKRISDEVEKSTPAAGAAAPGVAAPGAGPRELPDASFQTLVGTLATQIMMALGGMQDRRTGQRVVDLDLAKFHIDTLRVLEDKTKGNLSEEEKQMLDQVLYETRMHYVQIAQQVG